jgi:uncharacterized protein HemY
MNLNTHEQDTRDQHYHIELAIKTGDMAYARELLRQELQHNPSAELWYLAALVAPTPQQRIERLQQALALNPNHSRAAAALAQPPEPPAPAAPPSLLMRLAAALGIRHR